MANIAIHRILYDKNTIRRINIVTNLLKGREYLLPLTEMPEQQRECPGHKRCGRALRAQLQ